MCLRAEVRTALTPEAMETICGTDRTPAAASCRHAWVDARIEAGAKDAEPLITACAGDDECRFAVVDRLPEIDTVAQLRRCRLAGRYASDCRGHALQHWSEAGPSRADIARVTSAWPPEEPALGHTLAWLAACKDGPPCPTGDSAVAHECGNASTLFAANSRACNRIE
jgi:hypothetical protein